MGKQQPLSPEKYIITKARSLPLGKCYVTIDWQEAGMANVIVTRRHVNGNYTAGLYLVDLLCLGVKDTFYVFNVSEEEMEQRFDIDELYLQQAEYNLVHNIIYAGHDFAMEFDIKPHKDFSITKYILEADDDDSVPLIEIPVGDENGNPKLMVHSSYNYAPVLQKLKQHAGEGNYTFVLRDKLDDDDDDFDDDDDEFDEDEEFDEDDELDDDEDVFLDFNIAKDMETEDLEEIIEEQTRSFSDQFIINAELLLRQLNETENGAIEDLETLKEKRDFQLYEKKKEQWQKAYDDSAEDSESLFRELRSLGINEEDLDDEALMTAFLELLEKHKSNDTLSYLIVNAIPLQTLLAQFSVLENNFAQYTPSVQLFITSYAALQNREANTDYNFIINAATVEMAYPFNRFIHAMHHKLFWLVKAILAIQEDNKEKILYYHNLLRISGTGGHIKYLYAAQLVNWLSKYMGIEGDEEDNDDDN